MIVVVLLLRLLLLLLLLSPPCYPTLTQALRCGSMPPLASARVPLYSTERSMLGSFPNIRPNSVTPTRCVRPPPSRHSTRTPRGSAPHDSRYTT